MPTLGAGVASGSLVDVHAAAMTTTMHKARTRLCLTPSTVEETCGCGKCVRMVVAIAAGLTHHVWHERKEVVQLA